MRARRVQILPTRVWSETITSPGNSTVETGHRLPRQAFSIGSAATPSRDALDQSVGPSLAGRRVCLHEYAEFLCRVVRFLGDELA